MIIQKKGDLITGIGAGYGRKTVEQVCKQFDIPIQTAINRLSEKEIDAKSDELIKNIALDYDMLPIDVVEIIKGDSLEN